jgi:pantoate--beta-alanine ligase
MTMGALHAGHLDLVRAAAAQGGSVIVTIFVNPLQFGPGEDFDAYPRTLDADLTALAGMGVDVVYAPNASDMYPAGESQVRIAPGPMGDVYEGAVRPGHFSGVLTVVAKLLARTRPDVAVFGRKDAQQLALIRQMVNDLDFGVQLLAVPTHRDSDGLATSSRNRYLSGAQRMAALALPRALRAGAAAGADGDGYPGADEPGRPPLAEGAGEADGAGHLAPRLAAERVLGAAEGIAVDYFDIVDPLSFRAVTSGFTGEALMIGAIRVGTTRLIDNLPVVIARQDPRRRRPLPLSP